MILASDLGYGDISGLSELHDEVSTTLNVYASAILASEFWLPYPEGISRAKPLPS